MINPGTRVRGTLTLAPSDLLGRVQDVVYGETARDSVRGRSVLVTGAGGSIGSELVRQLYRLDPQQVFLLDHDESAMHALSLELFGHGLLDDRCVILADIRDRAGMRRLLADLRPHTVFHAAAHKHLPLLERYPSEGVKTNVLGTLNVVSASVAAGVERFVNISTDKAARPTSVLGATKRLAELVVAAHAYSETQVSSVRFGNVLGSRGSFLHSLAFQMANHEPVTITDARVTRYFMTIPEAAGLVIEASARPSSGCTYVLDMGEPVLVLDLVRKYAELSGVAFPEIQLTGLRQGEKLHEELLDNAETRITTDHPRVWAMRAKSLPPASLIQEVDGLHALTVVGDVHRLMARVNALLPILETVKLAGQDERTRSLDLTERLLAPAAVH